MSERIIVVGGGVMGLATAWQLVRRGERPIVLERFARGHHEGASHGETRNFNNAYGDAHYLDLLVRAREGWDALGEVEGEPLLRLHGLVSHGSGMALGSATTRDSDAGTSMTPSTPDSAGPSSEQATKRRPFLRFGKGWRGSTMRGEMIGASRRAGRELADQGTLRGDAPG